MGVFTPNSTPGARWAGLGLTCEYLSAKGRGLEERWSTLRSLLQRNQGQCERL